MECVLNMHGTIAQEDENCLHDEMTEHLLPDPTQSFLRRCGCRERRHKHQLVSLSVVVFGSTLLNIVLTILLLRVRSEHHERQKSLYGQCIVLCTLTLLIEAVGLEFDTVDTLSHFGPYGPSNENETERAILWENLDGSSAQVAVDKSWAA